MTTIINKEIGSISNIIFKGLGHPGPFSFTIENGNLPPGTIYDPIKNELTGTFIELGSFSFTIQGKLRDRIEGKETFEFNVVDWTIVNTDYKNLLDYSGQLWSPVGTVTKITNDPDLFDGECYELNPGGLILTMPFLLEDRDFEISIIIKPLNNGGTQSDSRLLTIGANNTSGNFVIKRNAVTIPPVVSFHYCPNGSTSNVATLTNIETLNNNTWNHILIVRKNGVMAYFLNSVRIVEENLNSFFDKNTLYLGTNNFNTERFTCRIKKLSIRINDSSKFYRTNPITGVWKYKFKPIRILILSSVERNNLLIETLYKGPYTVRVKEGYNLPTGLTIRNNRLTGLSTLEDNLEIILELVINGIVNDELFLTIYNQEKPFYVLNLPLTGNPGEVTFGDIQNRIWNRSGTTTIVTDSDNLRDQTSTMFDGGNSSLSLSDPSFVFGSADVCYSFWIKPPTNATGYALWHHFNNSNYLYVSLGGNAFTIALLVNGGTQWISYGFPNTLISNKYNHFVLVRKNGIWRTLINGKVISETKLEQPFLGDTIFVGGSLYNSGFNGSMFDFRVSTLQLEYWDEFIPPVITKWQSVIEPITASVGYIFSNRRITSNWPGGSITYKVNDFSALPVGLTLLSNGKIIGSPTALFTGITKVDCFIDDVLNHTVDVFFDITYFINELN